MGYDIQPLSGRALSHPTEEDKDGEEEHEVKNKDEKPTETSEEGSDRKVSITRQRGPKTSPQGGTR